MFSLKDCWLLELVLVGCLWVALSRVGATVTTSDAKLATGVERHSVKPKHSDKDVAQLCPNMVHRVFYGAMPRAEEKAGVFEEFPQSDKDNSGIGVDLRDCIAACCEKNQRNETCNVVFVFKLKCYHVRCISNEACLPQGPWHGKGRLQMVLVDPVQQQVTGAGVESAPDVSWSDILKAEKLNADSMSENVVAPANSNTLSPFKQSHNYRYSTGMQNNFQEPSAYDEDDYPLSEKRVKQLLISSMNDGENMMPEELLYEANEPHRAAEFPVKSAAFPVKSAAFPVKSATFPVTERELDVATTVSPKNDENKLIVVTVDSKEVRLPEKETTLDAHTVPDEQLSNSRYTYLWTLVNQPKGPMNGTISDQDKSKVKLSNLSEGLYTFKVSVTGVNGTFGEAMANVTVLPQKRTNKAPQAVITPREQTIRQPTTNAVLDGSTSTDDDRIISWRWEVISGPIGYQPKLPAVNTLQLTDLTSPGNYTFQLTVTDSNNVTNSTTANVTVLKGTDYPPVANAGDAVIIYLPNNKVTLNGTASSDDHEIVAWEWTKDATDESKAVDMQNTRTPYLQLSNLEEGMYTFMLKVTDGSGQSSSAKVHVFVKPPTNSPPVAKAGVNTTIDLPCNWVLLNGSQSVDDIRIESYHWQQKSGPNTALIANSNASIANATSLTLGLYEFLLSVVDENNNTATDSVWVKVIQEKNAAPVANAGGDQNITLPVSVVYLNGSRSWDDLAVVNYTWKRDGTSLAVGHVVGDTDKQPVMILSDVVPGHYVFKLTVTDEQGLSSTDSVTLTVHPDPLLANLVELTLSSRVAGLTQAELNSVVQKIGLLLGDMKVRVRGLKYDIKSDQAVLVFYVEKVVSNDGKSEVVNGLIIEQELKEKLRRDASILGNVFVDIRTTVCQNKCSGHGVCNSITRACICEAFWMPSALFFWGVVEANCDWSILYVFVFVIVGLFLLSGVFWGIACACRQTKKPLARPKVQKYSLIGTQDEEAAQYHRTTSLTDSDTDSDVLFETKSKPNGILRSNGKAKRNKGGHGPNSHGATKVGRRIRT